MKISVTVLLAAILLTAPAGAEMTPKEEVEKLLNAGLPFAQEMLQKYGEFHPFGAVLTTDGEVQMVAGYEGDEMPRADVVIALLMDGFLKGAAENRYAAVALFSNVTVELGDAKEPTSAIQAGLEHKAGYCVNVFLPYAATPGVAPDYQELVAGSREGAVFGSCQS